MEFRTEHDSLGEVLVEGSRYWGAQTQRSLQNFPANDKMPLAVIRAFAILKKAAAVTNNKLSRLSSEKCSVICSVCDEILSGALDDHFPLSVWQTGSGTQTNMNVNEVIANRGNELAGKKLLHPNDDVNMSQSSNDTFPTAMNIAAVTAVKTHVIPAVEGLIETCLRLEAENDGIIKIGRTHLQDATPVKFSQEISGWRGMLEESLELINASIPGISKLALGGTAVGTGINAPKGFDKLVASEISGLTGYEFITDANKFHALTGKDDIVFSHGALKALAADMMKIANDVRWLSCGPRCGFGEISIPANEPGSSIMPGKVNPTQCEQVTMTAVQVMAADTAIGLAASQGNFQLNVFMPVIIFNYLHSAELLAASINSFNDRAFSGLKANREVMNANLSKSLMLVTCLNPVIGYENAAKAAKYAFDNNLTLREAVLTLGLLTEEQFDSTVVPEKMV